LQNSGDWCFSERWPGPCPVEAVPSVGRCGAGYTWDDDLTILARLAVSEQVSAIDDRKHGRSRVRHIGARCARPAQGLSSTIFASRGSSAVSCLRRGLWLRDGGCRVDRPVCHRPETSPAVQAVRGKIAHRSFVQWGAPSCPARPGPLPDGWSTAYGMIRWRVRRSVAGWSPSSWTTLALGLALRWP